MRSVKVNTALVGILNRDTRALRATCLRDRSRGGVDDFYGVVSLTRYLTLHRSSFLFG